MFCLYRSVPWCLISEGKTSADTASKDNRSPALMLKGNSRNLSLSKVKIYFDLSETTAENSFVESEEL
jgi:hypothetical protein